MPLRKNALQSRGPDSSGTRFLCKVSNLRFGGTAFPCRRFVYLPRQPNPRGGTTAHGPKDSRPVSPPLPGGAASFLPDASRGGMAETGSHVSDYTPYFTAECTGHGHCAAAKPALRLTVTFGRSVNGSLCLELRGRGLFGLPDRIGCGAIDPLASGGSLAHTPDQIAATSFRLVFAIETGPAACQLARPRTQVELT